MTNLTTISLCSELTRAVSAHASVAIRGKSTKNALLDRRREAAELDMTTLDGIVTYDPSEFLITALAGTRMATLVAALAENGQYFPFDPVLGAAGATLGGTIASGISGPDRMLYGSLRDFVMEVELIDGLARLVRGGGKVVKNSAGFDLPKLMVGSYGRLGVLTEATLKVFPKPPAFLTQRFEFASLAATLAAMQKLQTNPLPISALEIEPNTQLVVRYGGRGEGLGIVAARAEQLLGQASLQTDAPESEAAYWGQLAEFAFVPTGCDLVRVGMSGRKLLAVQQLVDSVTGIAAVRYSAGASVAWLAVQADAGWESLDRGLKGLSLSGVVVRSAAAAGAASADGESTNGESAGLRLLGDRSWVELSDRIQFAMDPDRKFARF